MICAAFFSIELTYFTKFKDYEKPVVKSIMITLSQQQKQTLNVLCILKSDHWSKYISLEVIILAVSILSLA